MKKRNERENTFKHRLFSFFALVCIAGYTSAQELEEVVVTATKRSLSLQDAPLSITAFTSEQLERIGATEFFDYAVKVPNLGFAASADGRFDSRQIGIRGVFAAGQSNTGGTTGFYIDETPIPETMNPRVMDVERVEVLRGPQGSLYGARSMGGTVRLISKQPELNAYSARTHAAISGVDEGGLNWNFDGAVNIPVVEDRFALRLMGYYGEDSGVQDRVALPGSPAPFSKSKNVDDEKYYGGQIAAHWALTDNLTITPRIIYQKVEADGLPFADNTPGNFSQTRNFDIDEPGSDEFILLNANINWDTGIGDVVSSTAYFERDVVEDEDETFVLTFFFGTDPIPSVISQDIQFDSLVHETRFISDFDGRVQFTGGIFYEETNTRAVFPPALAPGIDQAFSNLVGAPFPPGVFGTDTIFQTNDRFDTDEVAVFFELSYAVNDFITATFGGRYSDTDISFLKVSDGIANGGPTTVRGEKSQSSFNPKFLVEAAINENINVYGVASKGFRIGGVNPQVSPTLCAADLAALGNPDADTLATFDSDKLWNYELGVKSTLLDRRLTMNIAAFYIDWKDVIQSVRLPCGFAFFSNVGTAENIGFELDINAQVTEKLTAQIGVGYTSAEFDEITNPFAPVSSGDRIQQVPEWTFTAAAEYTFPLGATRDGFFRADFSYYGDSLSANNSATVPRVRPSWTLLNLRLGVAQNNWEWTIFADNVTNEYANLADNKSLAAEHPARQRILTNRPRTIGVEARYNF